jgi:sugar O-acyltransferase (sialic acid O-acetyltransferase NeuD family)
MENPRQKIFLFGAGLHAQTCIDALEKQGKYQLVGLIDSVKQIGSLVEGYPVLGRMEDLAGLAVHHDAQAGMIAIGDNWVRHNLQKEIEARLPGFEFVNIIHPSAVFGKAVTLGKGIFIGAQAFISSHTTIGDFCLVHQKVHLGLHNHLADFVSISVGSITGGMVTIGDFTAITLGVVLHDRLNIGPHTLVGSGSLVTGDLPANAVAYGRPAKTVRKRQKGDPYLKGG